MSGCCKACRCGCALCVDTLYHRLLISTCGSLSMIDELDETSYSVSGFVEFDEQSILNKAKK